MVSVRLWLVGAVICANAVCVAGLEEPPPHLAGDMKEALRTGKADASEIEASATDLFRYRVSIYNNTNTSCG